MGVVISPELIDIEILDIINTYMNEAFPFLQTIASCSGWSNSEDGNSVSDGTNSIWIGKPYVAFESLDNIECLGKFVSYIMSKLIFDPQSINVIDEFVEYENNLQRVFLEYDEEQLVHFLLEYRNNKTVVFIYLYEKNRTHTEMMKIWDFFRNILIDYKQLLDSET